MEREALYEEIERYLRHEMTPAEVRSFEGRIKADPEIAEKVNLFKELERHLENRVEREAAEKRLLANLDQIGQEVILDKGQKTLKHVSLSWALAVAASVIIILGVVGYFFLPENTMPTYTAYARHDQLAISVRGEDDSVKQKAQEAFNEGNYVRAQLALRKLLDNDPQNVDFQMFYAISLIENNNWSEAEEVLKPLVEGSSIYSDKARWYWGLMYLKQHEYSQVAKIWRNFPASSEYSDKVRNILKDLQ